MSYDSSGQQAWFIGTANRQADGSYLATQVTITQGGIFGFEFDSNDVERLDWGTLQISFVDCDYALLEYESLLAEYGSRTGWGASYPNRQAFN